MVSPEDPRAWREYVVVSMVQAMWGLVSPQLRAVALNVTPGEVTVFFAVTDAEDEEVVEDVDDIIGDLDALLMPPVLQDLTDVMPRISSGAVGVGWEGFGHRLVLLTKDAAQEAGKTEPLWSAVPGMAAVAGRPPEPFPGEDGGRVSLAWENHIVVCLVQALLGHVSPQLHRVSVEVTPDLVTVFFAVPAVPAEEVYDDIGQVVEGLRQLVPAPLRVDHRVQVGGTRRHWEGNGRPRRLVIAAKEEEEDADETV